MLSVALEAAAGSCYLEPGEIVEVVGELLSARGHSVTVVTGPDIDSLAELQQYDVLVSVSGDYECGWNYLAFDPFVEDYVNGGGGLVTTGWIAYSLLSNTANELYPGIEAVVPVQSGMQFSEYVEVTPVGGHPITDGVAAFETGEFSNYGGGTRAGGTVLLSGPDGDHGSAWQVGSGRAVYLAPVYLGNYSYYDNEVLTDGSQPNAIELFLRSVEWAGGRL